MKIRTVTLILLGPILLAMSTNSIAMGEETDSNAAQPSYAEGILESIDNASVTQAGKDMVVTRKDIQRPIRLVFARCQGMGVQYEGMQWWVLPINASGAQIDANKALWVLPVDAMSKESSWHVVLHGGSLHATQNEAGQTVSLEADSATLSKAEARPHSDPFGNRFSLQMDDGPELENALAGFYWGTMLPSVVEKTMAAKFPYSSGYVLSTLNVKAYAGSYPAVDHEFQIKGRLAMSSALDLDVVRRMIELQFKLMNDDPERLFRAPTSVQPSGLREYHVRRNSQNNHQNAAMFPLTGNIEVIEEAWHYYEAKKDIGWVRKNIGNLEYAAGWILSNTDRYGRVWSDVYYEDQVMKDGRETEAQAFTAHVFELLAGMESLLKRQDKASGYRANAKMMSDVLIAPLPMGYWDPEHQRFIDWVDRNARVHDHIHLLANELPVLFGYATAEQATAVRHLIVANATEFERFPSFLSANIGDYDRSEIGDGGPYDLCAAGRYWFWDAAYYESQRQNDILLNQLKAVAAEGAKDNYFMKERYDMDHVYYIDGKNAHGAEKYYEYPNVFTAVLIDKYLGLSTPADADVLVAPHLKTYGTVEFDLPEYALLYSSQRDGFTLKNLSDKQRSFKVDLSALPTPAKQYRRKNKSGQATVDASSTLTLAPQEEASWVPIRRGER